MALALYEAARVWKEAHGFKGMKLVKVLVVDQALYFLMHVPFIRYDHRGHGLLKYAE